MTAGWYLTGSYKGMPGAGTQREQDMSTDMFTGHADAYTVGRPDYAGELIDYLYDRCGISTSSVIADIGSGTGKFSKHLLDRGSVVFSVEPNDDMRLMAEKELGGYPNFNSVKGDAGDTCLEAGSVDFVTTAQAFHWFDVNSFRKECTRILKHAGKVVLIWNIRDEADPVNRELFNVYSEYCPDFKGFGGGIVKDDQRIKDFYAGSYEYISFDHPLSLDRDMFIARSLSASYSLKEEDGMFKDYLEAVTDLFDRYSDKDIITIGNRSVAYIV